MRRQSYMAHHELEDYLKLACFPDLIKEIANRTPEKGWAKSLRMASTLVEKVCKERFNCLDEAQIKPLIRRTQNASLKFTSGTTVRTEAPECDQIVIGIEELNTLGLYVMSTCAFCDCSCHDTCKLRGILHQLGYDVLTTEPKEGQCEFHAAVKDLEKCAIAHGDVNEWSLIKRRNQKGEKA